jgi:hypothetical protein
MTTARERLANRINQLDQLEKEVNITPTYNLASKSAKQKLIGDIQQQREVCQRELGIRNDYIINKAALQEAEENAADANADCKTAEDAHDQLKRDLAKKYPEAVNRSKGKIEIDKFSTEDELIYADSKARVIYRREGVKLAKLAKAKTEEATQKVKGNEADFLELRRSNPNLYSKSNYNEPANPCIACLQNDAKGVGKSYETAKSSKIKGLKAKQRYNNCGVMSSALLINLVTCRDDIHGLDEDSMLDYATNSNPRMARKGEERDPRLNGPEKDPDHVILMSRAERARWDSGVTGPDNRRDLINEKGKPAGVAVEQKEYSSESLGLALKNHQPVILAVNARFLTPGYDDNNNRMKTWKDQPDGGHAVTAVDARYDHAGRVTDVLIADSGCGKQYWMKIEQLDEAVRKHPNLVEENEKRAAIEEPPIGTTMNVSNKPIKTDCPELTVLNS